jgi:hypothetical protein
MPYIQNKSHPNGRNLFYILCFYSRLESELVTYSQHKY